MASTEGRKTCGILFLRQAVKLSSAMVLAEMKGVENMENSVIIEFNSFDCNVVDLNGVEMSNRQLVEKMDTLVSSEHCSLIALLDHLAILLLLPTSM